MCHYEFSWALRACSTKPESQTGIEIETGVGGSEEVVVGCFSGDRSLGYCCFGDRCGGEVSEEEKVKRDGERVREE